MQIVTEIPMKSLAYSFCKNDEKSYNKMAWLIEGSSYNKRKKKKIRDWLQMKNQQKDLNKVWDELHWRESIFGMKPLWELRHRD